jgi:hypothetical protein
VGALCSSGPLIAIFSVTQKWVQIVAAVLTFVTSTSVLFAEDIEKCISGKDIYDIYHKIPSAVHNARKVSQDLQVFIQTSKIEGLKVQFVLADDLCCRLNEWFWQIKGGIKLTPFGRTIVQ